MKVVMFVSRNKDNKNVENFKPRSKSFIYDETKEKTLDARFSAFVNAGVEGETARMYVSVNKRNEEKVKKALTCALVMENVNLYSIESKVASIAEQVENAAEKKWLFDFDENNEEKVKAFAEEIKTYGVGVEIHKTKNAFAVVTSRGFDTRELMKRWKNTDVTLKRDAMLYVKCETKKVA